MYKTSRLALYRAVENVTIGSRQLPNIHRTLAIIFNLALPRHAMGQVTYVRGCSVTRDLDYLDVWLVNMTPLYDTCTLIGLGVARDKHGREV